MKLIAKLAGVLLILGGMLLASTVYTKNSTSELAGVMDQLNPLVKEGHVYVKTKEPDSVNGYGTAYYEQMAADENGKTRNIAFNGISELKEGRYLKLTNKGAHVETYEEIAKEEVPADALAQIDK
ncbi:YxeA family protein [Enterococcus saccharolyticus]|uniref:YxeA family protein n=1 Tax=Candidatus Enterococcus willemsii TaxID=1857215 RepID=A0ABQ6YXQ8_9ENTE|nr:MULTISPECIES: YxeA family protein [Enterococcus]KAF1302767.1 hypothetical protein BAU17_05640 [Enterococcus sp. CU12B]MCD5002446.1 YxeA family protein [Enterococcus saccharolyticus]